MIDSSHALPVVRQAELPDLSRASVYYLPRATSGAHQKLMKRIDAIHLETDFCLEALREAFAQHGQPAIFSTDQGSRFTSLDFTSTFADRGIEISMDGRGNEPLQDHAGTHSSVWYCVRKRTDWFGWSRHGEPTVTDPENLSPASGNTPYGRRLFLAAACAVATPSLASCSSDHAEQSAARALRTSRLQSPDTLASPMHDLVRQAILAPSSHNTQCWRFRILEKSIAIAPDLTRRCPAVDPDDHHLFVSLGCATENMVHAALAAGLHADPRFDPGGEGVIAVNLEATRKRISPLFQAISSRQCTRGDYDSQAISPSELRQPVAVNLVVA